VVAAAVAVLAAPVVVVVVAAAATVVAAAAVATVVAAVAVAAATVVAAVARAAAVVAAIATTGRAVVAVAVVVRAAAVAVAVVVAMAAAAAAATGSPTRQPTADERRRRPGFPGASSRFGWCGRRTTRPPGGSFAVRPTHVLHWGPDMGGAVCYCSAMSAREGRLMAQRGMVLWIVSAVAGCSGSGEVNTAPDADAGVMTTSDLGRGVDSGPPAPPPYQPTPLVCQGTTSACSTYDDNRTACNGVLGCNYGRCEFRELACIGFESYQCESGCSWDSYRERCTQISGGCSRTSPSSCQALEACRWSSTNTSIFDYNSCLGTATPCSALTVATCETQTGCEVGCPDSRLQCGSTCVDLTRDDNHCGGCDNACGAGASCVDGGCECDTPGHMRDPCGVCDAVPTNDCVLDCAGTPGGDATRDACGTCDANPSNDCDCAGTPGGLATVDMCGTCDAAPGNDCVEDCAGAWGGAATVDLCEVCDDNPANDCDCFLVPGGAADMDECGVCDADPSNDCAIDCSGVWGGPDRLDMCGVCDADAGNDCSQDCASTWGGTAQADMCGTCDSNVFNDCVQDCSGTWGGAATVDRCGTCDADRSNDCICLGVTCPASGPCFEGYCDLPSDTCMERPFPDGTTCLSAGTEICVDAACVTRRCQDGFLEDGPTPARELCDDRNADAGDLCDTSCRDQAFVIPEAGRLAAYAPSVGVDGAGRALIVWLRDDPGSQNDPVYAQAFDAFGAPDGLPFPIRAAGPRGLSPSVAGLRGGGWVVAFAIDDAFNRRIGFHIVAPNGAVGPERSIITYGGYPAVAALGSGFVLVWTYSSTLWAQRFSATGAPASGSFIAGEAGQYSPPGVVASSGENWFVAWWGSLDGNEGHVFGRTFRSTSPRGPTADFGTGSSPAVTAISDTEFALTYRESTAPRAVLVRRIPLDSPLAQTPIVVGHTTPNTRQQSVVPYGDSLLVAWTDETDARVIAAVGPTPLNVGDASTTLAALPGNGWDISVVPSPLGTWVVSPASTSYFSPIEVTLLRRP
jgi:hypothetical protein